MYPAKRKVADLKNNLSAYLREVRMGRELIVLDRDTPIAKIIPYTEKKDDFVIREPRKKSIGLLKVKRLKTKKKTDWLGTLEELRKDRNITW